MTIHPELSLMSSLHWNLGDSEHLNPGKTCERFQENDEKPYNTVQQTHDQPAQGKNH